jgi:hypothetical protein
MKVRVCPKCRKHNLENAWHCISCGTTLPLKSLIDTETSESSTGSFAGQPALSSISPYFEEDVAEVLRTSMQYDRSIIGGCNVTQPTRKPQKPKGIMGRTMGLLVMADNLMFGYLITTSQSLICVQFESRFNSRPCLEIWTTAYANTPAFAVDCPRSPLTPEEKASRKVTIYDLDDLVSAHLESIGHADISLMQLTASFRKGKMLAVSFYTVEEARAACKPLAARLGK